MTDKAAEKRKEQLSYAFGFGYALLLTVPLFASVAFDWLDRSTLLWITGVAAILQIVVHFRFFLHIRLKGQTKEDLQLILFTTLVMGVMGLGTIWVIFNLMSRM